jgi:hypothetical protein
MPKRAPRPPVTRNETSLTWRVQTWPSDFRDTLARTVISATARMVRSKNHLRGQRVPGQPPDPA